MKVICKKNLNMIKTGEHCNAEINDYPNYNNWYTHRIYGDRKSITGMDMGYSLYVTKHQFEKHFMSLKEQRKLKIQELNEKNLHL